MAVTENEAEVAPAGTVAEAGTLTAPLAAVIETVAPVEGAAEDSLIVQVVAEPLVTEVGAHAREEAPGGTIVRDADRDEPP